MILDSFEVVREFPREIPGSFSLDPRRFKNFLAITVWFDPITVIGRNFSSLTFLKFIYPERGSF
jgi:hypothetical protein